MQGGIHHGESRRADCQDSIGERGIGEENRPKSLLVIWSFTMGTLSLSDSPHKGGDRGLGLYRVHVYVIRCTSDNLHASP